MDLKYRDVLNKTKKLYITIEFLEKKILESSSPKDFQLVLKRIDSLMGAIKK